MKLYEINEQLVAVMECAELQAKANDGEISEGLAELLDSLEMAKDEKIGNICRYIKTELAMSDAIKAEAKALSSRARVHENKANRLREYLASFIPEREKFEDAVSKISWRKSESVEIHDIGSVPDEYVNTVRSPKKADIKKLIKARGSVDWAELKETQNLQIK